MNNTESELIFKTTVILLLPLSSYKTETVIAANSVLRTSSDISSYTTQVRRITVQYTASIAKNKILYIELCEPEKSLRKIF
jgi:hypothetical protein